jgi:elongation factor 1-beta
MASVIVTMKIMPESVETALNEVQEKATQEITTFCGETEIRFKEEPIAFGLKSLNATFVMDEAKGSTEDLENNIAKLDGVNSVEVTDIRRSIG